MARFTPVTILLLVSSVFAERMVHAEEQLPSTGPVVVELFTSQGCSSCPPADRLLTEINTLGQKNQLPIFCLSMHVDYWNSLGWKDPYSSRAFSERQRKYARSLQSRVYTPQMVIHGQTEFVGSRGGDAKQAISAGLASPGPSSVQLEIAPSSNKQRLEILFTVSGNKPGTELVLALVQKEASNEIPRGENAGRTLGHVHVVRVLKSVPLEGLEGKAKLQVPAGLAPGDISVIGFLQDPRTMRIGGATAVDLR